MEMLFLLLSLTSVIPSPGWSEPFLATDSANTARREQLIFRDDLGRFHLVWAGFNNESRIAYKMFDINGTTLYPETMISLDSHSSLHSATVMGDSLIVFWRDYSLVYYAIRSLVDGSGITPATYLFSASTMYPYIRACPDSLGRLHVLYNVGKEVHYAVWTPAPGSGFITDYEWMVEGADEGGVLLVDGNRVHLVVQDSLVHDFLYLQYDLEGNTTVPLTDFTEGDIYCSRFPELILDPDGNLMVVEGSYPGYFLWKLDKSDGSTIINGSLLVAESPPEMSYTIFRTLNKVPGKDEYFLTWTHNWGGGIHRIYNLIFDSDGNILVDWHIAYNYDNEEPEDLYHINGTMDEDGNLYLIYAQVETEPEIDYFPTFGWFDYNYVGTEQQEAAVPGQGLSFSCNPVTGSVTVYSSSGSNALRVFDISGREVSEISVSDGIGVWNGTAFSGERLPAGIYNIIDTTGYIQRVTLLIQ